MPVAVWMPRRSYASTASGVWQLAWALRAVAANYHCTSASRKLLQPWKRT